MDSIDAVKMLVIGVTIIGIAVIVVLAVKMYRIDRDYRAEEGARAGAPNSVLRGERFQYE